MIAARNLTFFEFVKQIFMYLSCIQEDKQSKYLFMFMIQNIVSMVWHKMGLVLKGTVTLTKSLVKETLGLLVPIKKREQVLQCKSFSQFSTKQ